MQARGGALSEGDERAIAQICAAALRDPNRVLVAARAAAGERRHRMSNGEKAGWTLAQLREFHEAQAWRLESDEKRRGAWPGEPDRRAAFEATVRVLDLILGDRNLVERLKAKARQGGSE